MQYYSDGHHAARIAHAMNQRNDILSDVRKLASGFVGADGCTYPPSYQELDLIADLISEQRGLDPALVRRVIKESLGI